jgi:hypothetical protein
MSGGGQTQTTVQDKSPWGPSVPYLNDIMANAQGLYRSGAPTVAGPSADQQLGFSQARNFAPANPMDGQAYGTMSGIAGGGPTASSQYLTGMASGADAGQNPYLLSMLDASNARIANRVNSSMAGMGRYGSGGHTDVLTRSLAEASNPILAQAYESDRNRMLQASGQIDNSARASDASRLAAASGMQGATQNYDAMRSMGIDRLLNTGATQTAQSQQRMDAPWTNLNRYLGSVSGLGGLIGGAGTSTGTTTSEQQTPWTQYAGLGIAGLGLLSDRNEKTDIKKLGKDEETGLDLYSYRYKGDPKNYPKIVGPMAQDVEKLYPGSTEKVGGSLYIKGDAMGILGLAKKAA